MSRLLSLSAAAALLAAPLAASAAPPPPVFTLTAKATKVADGSTWQGDGGRQVALFGNNVYIAFHGPAGEPSIARSTDGGLTWGTPAVLANDPASLTSGSARVAVAKDPLYAGKHVVYAAWGTSDGQVKYAYFVDRPTGTGWSAPVAFAGDAYSLALAAAPNGSVHLVFQGPGGTTYATAPSADAPFADPVVLPFTTDGGNHALAFDANSNLYMVESHWDGGAYVTFHKKLAAAASWSTVDVAVETPTLQPNDNVSIAVLDANNVYIAFKQYPLNDPNAEIHLWTAVSTNGGATWTRRIVTPNAGYYCTHPSIAVDAKKVITVAAHCVEYGPNGKVFVNRSSDGGATWSASVAVAGTQQVSLALDPNGKALVSAVYNDLSAADAAFLNGAIDPGWNSRPIYFTREK